MKRAEESRRNAIIAGKDNLTGGSFPPRLLLASISLPAPVVSGPSASPPAVPLSFLFPLSRPGERQGPMCCVSWIACVQLHLVLKIICNIPFISRLEPRALRGPMCRELYLPVTSHAFLIFQYCSE